MNRMVSLEALMAKLIGCLDWRWMNLAHLVYEVGAYEWVYNASIGCI